MRLEIIRPSPIYVFQTTAPFWPICRVILGQLPVFIDLTHYVDPSIAALWIGPNGLPHDLTTFGPLFKTLYVRDLRVFTGMLNGEVYHFRDKNGLECDTIIHLRNSPYGKVEN